VILVRSLLAATVAFAPVAASAATPVSHADVIRWAQAWNSHDIDTVLALFSKDVLIDQPENPKPLDYHGARVLHDDFSRLSRLPRRRAAGHH
jgi:hypothetical protein